MKKDAVGVSLIKVSAGGMLPRAVCWGAGLRGFSWKQPDLKRLQRELWGFGAETGLQGYWGSMGRVGSGGRDFMGI